MIVQVKNIAIGGNKPLVLIAGPCVVENEEMVMHTAKSISEITGRLGIPYIFKASYKKANRTSLQSFTGLALEEALAILGKVRDTLGLPVLTDIHTEEDCAMAAPYADILQIPAFLSRQTDLLVAAGKTGKVINIKKGQFLAPEDMQHAAAKVASSGNNNIMLTERGASFGYHNLVVDMRSLVIMRKSGYPIVMDATHAVQIPSQGGLSGGQPEFIKPIARAAVAVGIDALFLEVHPDPAKALSDAASQLALNEVEDLLTEIKEIDWVAKKYLSGK